MRDTLKYKSLLFEKLKKTIKLSKCGFSLVSSEPRFFFFFFFFFGLYPGHMEVPRLGVK